VTGTEWQRWRDWFKHFYVLQYCAQALDLVTRRRGLSKYEACYCWFRALS
jgi:hypothetical protein